MTTKTMKTLLEISVEPERPPFLDPLVEAIQPYIIALGVALILIAAAWVMAPRLRQRNDAWLPLAGIGVATLIVAAYIN